MVTQDHNINFDIMILSIFKNCCIEYYVFVHLTWLIFASILIEKNVIYVHVVHTLWQMLLLNVFPVENLKLI